MTTTERLTQTSPELVEALEDTLALTFGTPIHVSTYHTGGGCMVCAVDLSQDGRGNGRTLWLTRDEDWLLGFYDFADDEDAGVCVRLDGYGETNDSPLWVASQVAAILSRLGTTLA